MTFFEKKSTSFLRSKLKIALERNIKISYLHLELSGAKNPYNHIASQISFRNIPDRTTIDEQGLLPMAY